MYEAVDALTHMNGVYLGCLPLEIRFGRQEFGKVLWIGGLDETITERYRLLLVCKKVGFVGDQVLLLVQAFVAGLL